MTTKRKPVTTRQRRSFGQIINKHKTTSGKTYEYIECSYDTPIEAFSTWRNLSLPKRQYKQFPVACESDGEAWLNTAENAIRSGIWIPPQITKVRERGTTTLFKDYATAYVENRHKRNGEPIQETTKNKYREYLRIYLLPAFGDKRMSSITADDIDKWYYGFPIRKSGAGSSARAHVYSLLAAIFAQARTKTLNEEGDTLITANPCTIDPSTPQRKVQPKVATMEELDELYAAMPEWLRLSVYLCGVMSLREGECLALQRKDIGLNEAPAILHVRQSTKEVMKDGHRVIIIGKTKTETSVRDLPIPGFLLNPLLAHLDKFVEDEPDSYLFTSPRSGTLVKEQTVRNAWYRSLKQVPSLTGMRFYDLRHTALTHLSDSGAPTNVVHAFGGHSPNSRVAEAYQHATNEGKLQAAASLDAIHSTDTAARPDNNAEQQDATDTENGTTTISGITAMLDGLPANKRYAVMAALPAETLAKVIATQTTNMQ